MANKRRRPTSKRRASAGTPPVAPQDTQSNVPATTATSEPPAEPPAKGRLARAGQRVLDSGIDFLLDNFWLGVVFVMTAAFAAVVLYIRSGSAAWLYLYLIFALGFLTAGLALIALYGLLYVVQARRQRAAEQAKNLRFVSSEKGFLDFIVNKQRSEREFNTALFAISKEIRGLGETAAKFTQQVNPNTPFDRRQRVASKTARQFDKHSSKLEQELEGFERISDALIESNTGFINWLDPADEDHRTALSQSREVFVVLVDALQTTLPSTERLRDVALGLIGISQDLNTSVNRLTHVLNGIISEMSEYGEHWQGLIRTIDRKLSVRPERRLDA